MNEWLIDFERQHGRPLRVLHIGNIANNAYINAKIQRRIGIQSDVCCYDYYHIMGCPEWEDADFVGDVGDQFFPDWWAVELNGFARPEWFAQGRLSTCQRYLVARARGDSRLTKRLWRQLTFERWLRTRSTRRARFIAAIVGVARGSIPVRPKLRAHAVPGSRRESFIEWLPLFGAWIVRLGLFALAWLNWRLRATVVPRLFRAAAYSRGFGSTGGRKLVASGRALSAFARGRGWRTAALIVFPRRLSHVARTAEHHERVAVARAIAGEPTPAARDPDGVGVLYRSLFGDGVPQLAAQESRPFVAAAEGWKSVFAHYDIVQAYALDVVFPLFAGVSAMAAYEHGTLRDLPFEDSPRGRLCALGYRISPIVFVTNSDVIPSARRLGLTDDQMVFLPHAVDSQRLVEFRESHADLRPRSSAPITVLSPTRHDWADGDPLWAKGNDRLIRAVATARNAGVAIELVLFEWGRHVAASKGLIQELGLESAVQWKPTLRKRALWTEYMRAHVIADQFLTPALGSVAFEALALGCRVITAVETTSATQFFGMPPPLLNVATVEEIASALEFVAADPLDNARLGARAARWFEAYHSTERILELELAAYRRLIDQPVESRFIV